MSRYFTTDEELTSVADAIREKSGISESFTFPDGFISAISQISVGGDLKYAQFYAQDGAFVYNGGETLTEDEYASALIVGVTDIPLGSGIVSARIYGIMDSEAGDDIYVRIEGVSGSHPLVIDTLVPNEEVTFSDAPLFQDGDLYFISFSSAPKMFKTAKFSYDEELGEFVQENGDNLTESEITYIAGTLYADEMYSVDKAPSRSTVTLISGSSAEPVLTSHSYTYTYNENEPSRISIDGVSDIAPTGSLVVMCDTPATATGLFDRYQCAMYRYDEDEEMFVYNSGDEPGRFMDIETCYFVGTNGNASDEITFSYNPEFIAEMLFVNDTELVCRSPISFYNNDKTKLMVVNSDAKDYLSSDCVIYALWIANIK